jgi:hypothetical protein
MENIKIILDIINSLSTIILVVVAIIGLKQLTISKETRKINAKRDSLKLAAEQTVVFGEKIIPEIDTLNNLINENKLDFFTKSIVKTEGDNISVNAYTQNYSVEKMTKIVPNLGIVLNSLEAFSIYFVSGVAAESVTFETCGSSFVLTVNKLMPFIVSMNDKTNGYKNTLKLFRTWNSRLESEKLIVEKGKIEAKLEKTKTISIKPIGTE